MSKTLSQALTASPAIWKRGIFYPSVRDGFSFVRMRFGHIDGATTIQCAASEPLCAYHLRDMPFKKSLSVSCKQPRRFVASAAHLPCRRLARPDRPDRPPRRRLARPARPRGGRAAPGRRAALHFASAPARGGESSASAARLLPFGRRAASPPASSPSARPPALPRASLPRAASRRKTSRWLRRGAARGAAAVPKSDKLQ